MFSYKPLLRLLVEKDMTKTQLREATGMSMNTLAKISKNEYVSMSTLDSICKYFHCFTLPTIYSITRTNNIFDKISRLCYNTYLTDGSGKNEKIFKKTENLCDLFRSSNNDDDNDYCCCLQKSRFIYFC